MLNKSNNNAMEAITIDQLYEALKEAREKGLGSKKILITNDDEGNGYHEAFYSVTEITPENIYMCPSMMPFGVSVEDAKANYVVIG